MRHKRLITAIVATAVLALAAGRARGAGQITMLCSNGLKADVEELAPQFERSSGDKVAAQYALAATIKQRIEAGEAFDVAVVTPGLMDDLMKSRKVAADTRATIARSGLAIAVKAGARKRDVTTVDGFKRALLDARGLAYAKEGASGVAF